MTASNATSARPEHIRRRSMADITRELEALRALTSRQLAKKYLELFGMPTRSNNREYLLRQIAWKLQDDGGHFEKVRKRVAELASHVDVPVRWQQKAARAAGLVQVSVPVETPVEALPPKSDRDPRLPPAGSILVREYEGKRHEVVVLDDGFEHRGNRYARLTQIAAAITGRKWNGFEFFKVALADATRARAA